MGRGQKRGRTENEKEEAIGLNKINTQKSETQNRMAK